MSDQRLVHNAKTGEQTFVDLTADEIAEREAWNHPDAVRERAQAAVDAQRHAAYTAESDPLFFQWQRGAGTEQAWLGKIAEIQARYPDPPVGGN